MKDKPPIKANGKMAFTRVICTTNGEHAPPTWLARDTMPMPLFLKWRNRCHLLNAEISVNRVSCNNPSDPNVSKPNERLRFSVRYNHCICLMISLSQALTFHLRLKWVWPSLTMNLAYNAFPETNDPRKLNYKSLSKKWKTFTVILSSFSINLQGFITNFVLWLATFPTLYFAIDSE